MSKFHFLVSFVDGVGRWFVSKVTYGRYEGKTDSELVGFVALAFLYPAGAYLVQDSTVLDNAQKLFGILRCVVVSVFMSIFVAIAVSQLRRRTVKKDPSKTRQTLERYKGATSFALWIGLLIGSFFTLVICTPESVRSWTLIILTLYGTMASMVPRFYLAYVVADTESEPREVLLERLASIRQQVQICGVFIASFVAGSLFSFGKLVEIVTTDTNISDTAATAWVVCGLAIFALGFIFFILTRLFDQHNLLERKLREALERRV